MGDEYEEWQVRHHAREAIMEILRAISRQENDGLSGEKVCLSMIRALGPVATLGHTRTLEVFEQAIQHSIDAARGPDYEERRAMRISDDPSEAMRLARDISAQRAAKVLAERISKQATQKTLAESKYAEALREYMAASLEVRKKYRGY